MENKEIKKEELSAVKNLKVEVKEEIKMPDYKAVTLNVDSLIKKDDVVAKLMAVSFEELSVSELKQLLLCKAKVEHIVNERYDRRGKKLVSERDVLSIKICKGLIINRSVDELEMNLIKTLAPELIGKKSELSVPVKMITYIDKNGRRGFRYIAYICPGVYFKGFFLSKQLTSILVSNLQSENKIRFYEVDQNALNLLAESQDEEVDDDF